MVLKKICKGCEKFATCDAPCEKLEELLPAIVNLDCFKKVDLGQVSGKEIFDTNIESLEQVLRQEVDREPVCHQLEWEAPPLTFEEFNDFVTKYNHLFSPRSVKKLFVKYMTSDLTIEQLADIQGCTTQNLHKIFTRLVRNLAGVLLRGKLGDRKIISPKTFKAFLRLDSG